MGKNAEWKVRQHGGMKSYKHRRHARNGSESRGSTRRREGRPTGVEGADRELPLRMVQREK